MLNFIKSSLKYFIVDILALISGLNKVNMPGNTKAANFLS
jgi:hypothetical protein